MMRPNGGSGTRKDLIVNEPVGAELISRHMAVVVACIVQNQDFGRALFDNNLESCQFHFVMGEELTNSYLCHRWIFSRALATAASAMAAPMTAQYIRCNEKRLGIPSPILIPPILIPISPELISMVTESSRESAGVSLVDNKDAFQQATREKI